MIAAPAIETRGLVKRYGTLTAVDGVDLVAMPGTCLGVLGPNGAGKRTTIEILEGLQEADGGEVRVLGQSWGDDARALRTRIGVQLQETRLPDKLTVLEVVRLFRAFYPKGRAIDEIIELVGLGEKRTTRTNALSGGQRQRLALACGLVGDPEVLFLDEPTTGLDPQARRRVWEIVKAQKQAGRTVLLTTHYMDEAERLSDDLVILDHGKVIARGSPRSIIDSLGAENVISLQVDDADLVNDLRALDGVREGRVDAGRIELTVQRTDTVLPALVARVRDAGLEFLEVTVFTDADEAAKKLLTGAITLLVIDDGPTLRLDTGRSESETARLRVDDVLQAAAGRVDVIDVAVDPVRETGARYIDFLLPGLLGMNLMGTGMWGTGFSVVDWRQKKLLKLFTATPMRRSYFLVSQALSRLVFLVVEVVVIVVFGVLVLGVPARGNLAGLSLVCLLGAAAFSGLGLLVASRATTIEGVSGLMNFIMMPMWLLSGVFFTYERFPEFLHPAIRLLPLPALNDALRANMLEGAGLATMGQPIIILALTAIFGFTLALRWFRWQ